MSETKSCSLRGKELVLNVLERKEPQNEAPSGEGGKGPHVSKEFIRRRAKTVPFSNTGAVEERSWGRGEPVGVQRTGEGVLHPIATVILETCKERAMVVGGRGG